MSVEVAYRMLQLAGAAVVFLLAWRSFERRSIQLGEEPTLPRYFARRGLYWIGIVSYGTLIALLFLGLVSIWMPLKPLVDAIGSNITVGDPGRLLSALTGRLLLPLIAVAAFLFFIAWESRFNPMLLVRDAVCDMFAIPRKAVEVYNVLRSAQLSGVGPALREQAMTRLLVPSLDPEDFDRASDTVEYKWARCCVLFDQIQTHADDPSYRRFFKEPSLKWGQICLSFNEMSERVANWKAAEPHYTKTLELIEGLDVLTGLLCRLLACLVVFGNAGDRAMWRSVIRLGGDPRLARLKHTHKYLLTFSGAIVFAVMLGREVSVLLYNAAFQAAEPLGYFQFDTLRWVVYAVSMYMLPIAVVFAARIEAYRAASDGVTRYYGFYAAMMVSGFLLSVAVSALITGIAGTDDEYFSFVESFVASLRWGILPALMCGFVAYQMDSPVDETEPKSRMWQLGVIRLFTWSLVGLLIILYATDEMPLDDKPGLRFTIVITTAFVSGFLGAVARFKVIHTGFERPTA